MGKVAAAFVGTALVLSIAGPRAAAAQGSAEPQDSGYTIELEAGVGLAVGLFPNAAIGGAVGILVQSPYFLAVEIVGSLYPFVAQDTGVGDAHWLGAFGGFLLCTDSLDVGSFSFRGCAGGEIGFVHVRGVVDPAADYVAGQVLVRARLSYQISESITIWTRPTLGINARTDPYVTDIAGVPPTLYDPAPVIGLFDFGVGWVFD